VTRMGRLSGQVSVCSGHSARLRTVPSRLALNGLVVFVLALVLVVIHTGPASAAYRYDVSAYGYDRVANTVPQTVRVAGGLVGSTASSATARLGSVFHDSACSYATNTAEASLVGQAFPDYDGFLLGYSEKVTLQPGTLIDRYGVEAGRFLSPQGTSFAARGLPAAAADAPYAVYEVVEPLEVAAGVAAPAFGQAGMGIQYLTSSSVADLLEAGVLRVVP